MVLLILPLANTRWHCCLASWKGPLLQSHRKTYRKQAMGGANAHLTAWVKWHVSVLLLQHGHHIAGVQGPPLHQEAGVWGCRLDVTTNLPCSGVKGVTPRFGAAQEVDHLCLTAKPGGQKWAHQAMYEINTYETSLYHGLGVNLPSRTMIKTNSILTC